MAQIKRKIKTGILKKFKLSSIFPETKTLISQKIKAKLKKIPIKNCLLKLKGSTVKGRKKIGKRKTKK